MSKEAIAIKALEALARLGNGDQYGNSTGNVIARTALFEMAEQPAHTATYTCGACGVSMRMEQPAPAAPVQEPCGWQFFQDGKWHNGMETNNHRANTDAAGVPVRDVYPSPPAQQEPLTDEQIKDVAASCMWWVREQDILDDAIELARAVEAAHGIKEST